MNRAGLALSVLAMVAFPLGARAQSVGAHRPGVAAHAATAAPTAPPEGVVNINTASADELERLPGIGPARAAAIVTLRGRVQRFHAPDDLLRVRGIGHAGMRRMRPYVTLTGGTTLTVRPGRSTHAPSAALSSPPVEGGS